MLLSLQILLFLQGCARCMFRHSLSKNGAGNVTGEVAVPFESASGSEPTVMAGECQQREKIQSPDSF